MVASGRGRLPPRRALTAYYTALLGTVREAPEWLAEARPLAAAVAREATPMAATPVLAETWLRVGDAALAVDPLSGHSIFVAIGGALAAAPVINTLLRRPEDGAPARRLYSERAKTGRSGLFKMVGFFWFRNERKRL